MTRLIGLAGAAGSGKDTAAQALIDAGYRRDAFADRMRKAILALNPIVHIDVWEDEYDCSNHGADGVRLDEIVRRYGWDTAKREYPEVRALLQRFGTEAGRDIYGDNHWVDLLINAWHDAGQPPTVVTDCRFVNEAHVIRSLGGTVIRIVRPGLEALPGAHASEAGLPDVLVDYTVVNDGTVEDLHKRLLDIVRSADVNV